MISHRVRCFWNLDRGAFLIALSWGLTACPLSDHYAVDIASAGAGASGGSGGSEVDGTGGEAQTGGTAGQNGGGAGGDADADANGGAAGGNGGAGSIAGSVGVEAGFDVGAPRINLALNKSATASSEQTSKGNLAPLGNDGDPNSRWSSADALTPKWWRVDLGTMRRISRVEIDWEFARVYGYLIEVSNDDLRYFPIVDRSNNADPTQSQGANVNATARYVRITITSVVSSPVTWASFWEIRVF